MIKSKEIKLYEIYNVYPDKFKDVSIKDCGFCARTENALIKRAKTVYELLTMSTENIERIRNLGAKSFDEIEDFVFGLRDDKFNVDEYHTALKLNVPYDIYVNRFNIIQGDLRFMEGRNCIERDYAILKEYIESISIIDPELFQLCRTNPKKIKSIAHALSNLSFVLDIERRKRNFNS